METTAIGVIQQKYQEYAIMSTFNTCLYTVIATWLQKKNSIPLCLPDDCDLIDVTWTRMFERCPCPSLVICQHVFSRLPVPSSSLCFHLAQVLVEKIETRIGNFFALGVYQTILNLYILTLQEYWNHEFHEASALPCSSQY